MLADKGINRGGFIRAGYGSKKRIFDILPHALTNFEIKKFYQNELRFNGAYSRDNLPNKIKDGAHVTNLGEYFSIGTHWISMHELNNNVTYFDSFGVEHIPKEIKMFIDKSTVVTKIFRVQEDDSVMCRYFCIGFIDFMLKGKRLTDFINIFSPNDFKENDDIILNHLKNRY